MLVVATRPEEENLDQRKKTDERRSSSIHFLFDTLPSAAASFIISSTSPSPPGPQPMTTRPSGDTSTGMTHQLVVS
jgi:hypothetical protein